MSEDELVEYLVIGGSHHGEVWLGSQNGAVLLTDGKNKTRGVFFTRDKSQEISALFEILFPNDVTINGHGYKVFYEGLLDKAYIQSEIDKVYPPLKPFN